MSKTLRIVAKDARHLWPEILLYLGIVIAFAAVEPWGWPSYFHQVFPHAQDLRALLEVLLPLTWWLLIARSVQDESLVGDRQFWTTRPYGWQRILAAKIIFLAVFVALPFLFAKAWLLHYAGLSPFANGPTLFLNMLATTVLIFLPLFSIAVVTANLVRMFLVFVAGCLFVGFVLYLNSFSLVPQTYGPTTIPFWIVPVSAGICVAAILVQYARRRTMIVGTTLIALCVALALFISINEHTWNPHRLYQEQRPNEPPPFTLILNPDRSLLGPPPVETEDGKLRPAPGNSELPPSPYQSQIGISIPLVLKNVPANHSVTIDNLAISYTPQGEEREIFSASGGKTYLPGEVPQTLNVSLSLDNYRKWRDTPLAFDLTIAETEAEATASASSKISTADFAVLNGGICHPSAEQEYSDIALNNCQFPLDRPDRTLVTAPWSDRPCREPSSPGEDGLAWIGSDNLWRLPLDFDPVQNEGIFLSGRQVPAGKSFRNRFLCPGTAIKFTNYSVIRRRIVHISLQPILPHDYTKHQEDDLLGQSFFPRR